MRLALTFHVMLQFFTMCDSGDVCSSRSRHRNSALVVKKDTADIARRQGQDLDIWEQVENTYVLLLALGHLTTDTSNGFERLRQSVSGPRCRSCIGRSAPSTDDLSDHGLPRETTARATSTSTCTPAPRSTRVHVTVSPLLVLSRAFPTLRVLEVPDRELTLALSTTRAA